MDQGKDQMLSILQKYVDNNASPEEYNYLHSKLHQIPDDEISGYLEKIWNSSDTISYELTMGEKEEAFKRILSKSSDVIQKKKLIPSKRYFLAAIAIIAGIIISGYFIFNEADKSQNQKKQIPGEEILPGSKKAILKTAEGEIIALGENHNQSKYNEKYKRLLKAEDGHLIFPSEIDSKKISYNELTTPRGGEFLITLPDGTKVWLNAASQLKFPSVFNDADRKVELHGEAFFEVTSQKDRPFIVEIPQKGEVIVTGTKFNINAYEDEEAVKTTLIEGSVNIKSATTGDIVQLRPGNEAVLSKNINVTDATNTSETTAWKDGIFVFDKADLSEIMRQVSRWYDVDVQIMSSYKNKTYSGIVDRKKNASEVLKILIQAGVKFRVEDKKIIVIQ
jgi:transmembrane sensor